MENIRINGVEYKVNERCPVCGEPTSIICRLFM